MIHKDQPTCFGTSLLVGVSSVVDGTMLDRSYGTTEQPTKVMMNRKRLCLAIGNPYENTVYQQIRYAENLSYDKIVDVTEADTTSRREAVHADALYTEEPHVGLFLPVADCIATVFYDPVRRALCVAHLGRHSTVANLADKVVKHFVEKGTRPEDLIVWLSPHVSREQYVLEFFNPENESAWKAYTVQRKGKVYVDLEGFNIAAVVSAGVERRNIHVSDTCTFTSPDYFSHSNGDTLGRFAIVASIA